MILRSAADGRRHERPRLRARSPRLRPLLPPAGSLGGSSPVGPAEPPTPLRTAAANARAASQGNRARVVGRHRRDRRPSCRASPERNRGERLRATRWHPRAASRRHRRAARRRCPDATRAEAGGAIRRRRCPASLRPEMDGRCRRAGRRDWTSRNSAEQRCRSRLAKPSQHFSVTHDPCCSTGRRYRPGSTPIHRQHRRGSTRVSRLRQAARSYCTPRPRRRTYVHVAGPTPSAGTGRRMRRAQPSGPHLRQSGPNVQSRRVRWPRPKALHISRWSHPTARHQPVAVSPRATTAHRTYLAGLDRA